MKKTMTILSVLLGLFVLAGCTNTTTSQTTTETPVEITIPEYKEKAKVTDVTVDGKKITIENKMIAAGDTLADVELAMPAEKFNETEFTTLSKDKKVKVIYTAPSIDTPVCSKQTQQLEAAAKKMNNIGFYMISADLPFAQSRFCTANKIDNLKTLSDFKGLAWGKANGFAMKEYGLLTRAIIVVDENNVVKYVEYTSEVTSETDLGNALAYIEQIMKVKM